MAYTSPLEASLQPMLNELKVKIMKPKNKGLGIARAAILSISLFLASGLTAQTASRPIPKDNEAIENDVSAVNAQKAKVDEMKGKLKEDDRSGLKEMAVIDKKELSKAKAELRKDRSFLMADVRDVSKDNRIAVRNSKKAIRLDKADLRKSRRHLRSALKQGDDASIRFDKSQVKSWERILDSDKERLKLEKDKRSYDRAFLKKEMKRLEGGRQWVYLASL
jgi:hypothetical protein